MIKLTKNKVREIYQDLDCGMRCFYNSETDEIKSLPDFDSNPYADEELWQDVSEELDSNFDKYIEFDKLPTREYFQIMTDFIDSVVDKKVQGLLVNALNKSKPFRNFKYEIDNSGEYRQKWFDFKDQEYCKWIETQIQELNDLNYFKQKQNV
jgi:hypothetical protein